eukprot:c16529_g1_i1.p1 GENE.c16529_g1_i1~~c16529_g1_i1.p1  ORF type:complete len:413 (-),score=155.83 c16529_g1_i1:6-1244(-)
MEEAKVFALIYQFLEERGYNETIATLESESGCPSTERSSITTEGTLITILNNYELDSLSNELKETEIEELTGTINEDLLHQGDGNFCRNILATHTDIHKQNVLCVRFQKNGDLLASSSSDKSICVMQNCESEELKEVKRFNNVHSAGILDLDWHPKIPSLLLSCSMDRTHAITDTSKSFDLEFGSTPVLQTFSDHQKYVCRCRWSPGGRNFVTTSYDSTVNIYGLVNEEEVKFELLHRVNFNEGAVEALSFIDDNTCVITKREDHRMYYLDVNTFQTTVVNMNAKGDSHVSFTALDLVVGNKHNYVVAVTDKSRAIMFDTRSPNQLRNFYGATNDGFSMPSGTFDCNDKYFFSTSQAGPSIVCWDVALAKVVNTINPYPSGHQKNIRKIDHHSSKNLLVSGGYDLKIKLWGF